MQARKGLQSVTRNGIQKAELSTFILYLRFQSASAAKLQEWARRPKTAQRLALRARIVLSCAEGMENRESHGNYVQLLSNAVRNALAVSEHNRTVTSFLLRS